MPVSSNFYQSRSGIYVQTRVIAVFFLVLLFGYFMFSCNKNINASANKSFVGVTNAASGAPDIDAYFEQTKLTSSGPLGYCASTGVPGNPYDTAIAGIHAFKISSGSNDLASGNIAFSLGHYYSVFVYDTVLNNSVKTLVLQDDVGATYSDTVSATRYLNLAPDSTLFDIILTNQVDTSSYGFVPFVGPSPVPGSLSPFQNNIIQGSYGVIAYVDSVHYIPLDSIIFVGGKTYTVFVTGFYNGTGAEALGIHLLQHN